MSAPEADKPYRRLAFGPNPYFNIEDNDNNLKNMKKDKSDRNGVASFLTCGIYGDGKVMKENF